MNAVRNKDSGHVASDRLNTSSQFTHSLGGNQKGVEFRGVQFSLSFQ